MTKKKTALLFFIFIVGIFLKFNNYAIYPQRGATSDEYTYAFLGTSLLTKGVPISWSAFKPYKNLAHLTIDNIYFPIVWPYFDHPPLYGIVVGGFSILFGQSQFVQIDLKTIRLVPIVLSSLSALFLFLIANKLYGFKVGVFSLLIYITTTIFVVNQRVSVAENQLTLLFLLIIYLFIHFRKDLSKNRMIALGILTGAALFTKIVGGAIFLPLLFLFFYEKVKRKNFIAFLAAATFCLFGLFVYAFIYDWNLFWEIQKLQSLRPIGPETLLMLRTQPVIVNKIYHDGWYFLGLLSLMILAVDFQKHKYILAPSFTFFFILLWSLSSTGLSGWYMIPLFPFMAIATAYFVVSAIQNKQILIILLPLFIGFYQIEYIFEANFGLAPNIYRIALVVLFLPFILAYVYKKKKIFEKLSYFWFYLFILGNVYLTYTYIHPA